MEVSFVCFNRRENCRSLAIFNREDNASWALFIKMMPIQILLLRFCRGLFLIFLPSEILNALHEDAIHELLLGTFGQRHV